MLEKHRLLRAGAQGLAWNSSTEKVARPWRVPVSDRSCSTCMATAVEESASPPPSTMAHGPATLDSCIAAKAIATVVAST